MHFTTLLSFFAASTYALLVPGPPGPYSVALQTLPLTDTSRLDPYADTETHRRVLLSVFLPVPDNKLGRPCKTKTVPYMSPSVAEAYGLQAAEAGLPNTTFAMFELELCDLAKSCGSTGGKREKFPLVMYSPGLGISRELYGARARSLASHGGTIIPAADIDETNTTQIEKAVNVRRQDISFALSQLPRPEVHRRLLARYPYSIDFSKVAAIGHSVGGAASAAAAAADSRITGGINMDGRIVNPVLRDGLSKPFIQIGRPGHSEQDASWNEFWPHLRSQAMEVAVAQTTHGSFPDTLTLLSALGLPESAWEALRIEYGAIDPVKMEQALNGVWVAFLYLVFTGDGNALAVIQDNCPEITVLRRKFT